MRSPELLLDSISTRFVSPWCSSTAHSASPAIEGAAPALEVGLTCIQSSWTDWSRGPSLCCSPARERTSCPLVSYSYCLTGKGQLHGVSFACRLYSGRSTFYPFK